VSAAVCPVNPPGHDWEAGLSCRWCDASRTPSEAVLSGLASVRGWSRDAARAVRDAYRAELLAEAKTEVVAWLVKKAAEGNDPIESLASKVDRGAIRIFLGTGHYRDAMDAHRAEVRTEDARLLEDAACDADWTRTPDYCAGLRAGAELLLANTGEEATAAAATATPDQRAEILTEAIDDLTNCLRLGGIAQRGLVLARKRLTALRDGDTPEPPRRNVSHPRTAERCREKPGEWLTVGTYSSAEAATATARMIRGALVSRASSANAYAPAGTFEARTAPAGDRTRVEARYVGTTAEAGDGRD
jgi:hypothetical protein